MLRISEFLQNLRSNLPRFLVAFGVLAILGLIAFWSVRQVRFSANIMSLFPADLVEVQGMERLNRHFSRGSELIVTLSAPDPVAAEEAAASLADTLEAHPELVQEVFWELPLDRLAQEASGLLSWLWLNLDPEELKLLEERLAEGQSQEQILETLEALEDAFLDAATVVRSYDPYSLMDIPGGLQSISGSEVNPLASKDGTFRVLYVEGAGRSFSDYREAKAWTDDLWKVVEEWQTDQVAGVKIGFTGTPAFMGEIGTGMERDMTGSLMLTTNLIATLFLLMHRRLLPLLWLVIMMLAIFVLTINFGGLIFGDLSVMSAGFAAILMGLAVDYGVVLYREVDVAEGSAKGLRRMIGPSIVWAAATTAAVFLSLNLSSLPGISQLGNLVAIGIAIGAAVMLYAFSPLAVRFRTEGTLGPMPGPRVDAAVGRYALITALVVPALVILSILIHGAPGLDPQFRPFDMRGGQANESWSEMHERLRSGRGASPLIVVGEDADELQANLEATIQRIEAAEAKGLIAGHEAPLMLVPDLTNQQANIETLQNLFGEEARLVKELEDAGFSEEGWKLTQQMFEHWRSYQQQLQAHPDEPVLAEGTFARWLVRRVISHTNEEWAVLGAVNPNLDRGREWINAVCDDQSAVASMRSLGAALNERIGRDLFRVFLPMMLILSLMLALVFRNWRDVTLTVFTLLFSAGILIVITHWSPLGWNSFNICGVPLLFGTGLDYGIHMIFALRRSGGDLSILRPGISRALIFCGLSTTIGFGSLAFSSAEGLASLGQICALGVLINMVAAVFLLPHWWRWLHGKKDVPSAA